MINFILLTLILVWRLIIFQSANSLSQKFTSCNIKVDVAMSANGHGSSSEWQSYFISDFTSKDSGLHINHFPVRKIAQT